MGVDICFYLQKNTDGEWRNISLYNADNKFVDIWRCGGEAWDYVKENWRQYVPCEDVQEVAEAHGWEYDYETLPFYCATLTKLAYLSVINEYSEYNTPDEDEATHKFFEELLKEIKQYIDFAGDYFIDSDNIRIIALVSY